MNNTNDSGQMPSEDEIRKVREEVLKDVHSTSIPKPKEQEQFDHLTDALIKYKEKYGDTSFIVVENNTLGVMIQKGPIKEVGINGIQVTDLLKFVKELYTSLNDKFYCNENVETLVAISAAIDWQDARTRSREQRGVEGFNKE